MKSVQCQDCIFISTLSMRVSSRDFLISNSNSGGHTLSNGFDLLKVEKRNRKLNRWGRKWCNLKIYEVVNYGILHNFYGQTVRIFYYSNSFKYFRVGEKVIFMIRSAFIQKLPQHWFSADSNRLYKKCSGRDPMLAWEREKNWPYINRTRHTTTYTFTRIENKRNPNTKPLHTVLSQQNEGKNCMNLYGAHVVQVDNLQRNISKTWINYEPTYTHNRVTLASYSYSYRIQYKTGTRIRYLHGASQKSHDSQSLLLSYSGWFWLYVETVFRFHSISFVCIRSRFSLYSNICTISILDNTPTMSVYHTSDCRMKRWKGWGKLYMYKHISLWLTFTYSSTFCWLLTKFQWLVCSNLFHFDASLL